MAETLRVTKARFDKYQSTICKDCDYDYLECSALLKDTFCQLGREKLAELLEADKKEAWEIFWEEWLKANELQKYEIIKTLPMDKLLIKEEYSHTFFTLINSYFVDFAAFLMKKVAEAFREAFNSNLNIEEKD